MNNTTIEEYLHSVLYTVDEPTFLNGMSKGMYAGSTLTRVTAVYLLWYHEPCKSRPVTMHTDCEDHLW